MAITFVVPVPAGVDKEVEAYHCNIEIGSSRAYLHFNIFSTVNGEKLNDTIQDHLILEESDYADLRTALSENTEEQFIEDYITNNYNF